MTSFFLFFRLGSILLLNTVVPITAREFLILPLDFSEFTNEDRIFARELSLRHFLKNSRFAEYTPEARVGRKTTAFQTVEHGLFTERASSAYPA